MMILKSKIGLKMPNLGSEKTVHCEWFSELVEEGENFVYVESHDIIGNGSYASAKEWFI